MKQYYKTIKRIGQTDNIAYWYSTQELTPAFTKHFDFIIPLGNKKPPKDITPLDVKEITT